MSKCIHHYFYREKLKAHTKNVESQCYETLNLNRNHFLNDQEGDR